MEDETSYDALSKVAGGAALIFGGRIVKLGLLFIVQLVMARLLGASAYGAVVLAMMIGGVGSLVAKAGLPRGLTQQIPYYEEDPERGRGVVKAGIQLAFLFGTVVGTSVFLAAPFLATRIFNAPSITPLLQVGALGIPLGVLQVVSTSIARGVRDAKTHVIVRQLLNPLAQVLFIGGLVLAGLGAIGAMVGGVLASAVGMVAAVFLARWALPFSVFGPTVRMHRELLTFSLPLMFAAGMDFLVVQADTILIGVFLASSDVGIYNVAFRLREVGMFFFYPITFLLPPVLTRLTEQEKSEDARRIYEISSKWLVLLTTPLFLLLFMFPRVVIELTFGGQYIPGAMALRMLMVPIMVTVLLSANGAALIALGHNRTNLYVNAGAAALNVMLNMALIPMFGILGAAISSAASFITRDVLFALLLYRWEGLQPFSASMLRPYLATLVFAGIGYLVFLQLFSVTALSVVAVGLVFLVFYSIILVVLGASEPEDERLLSLVEERMGTEFSTARGVMQRLKR